MENLTIFGPVFIILATVFPYINGSRVDPLPPKLYQECDSTEKVCVGIPKDCLLDNTCLVLGTVNIQKDKDDKFNTIFKHSIYMWFRRKNGDVYYALALSKDKLMGDDFVVSCNYMPNAAIQKGTSYNIDNGGQKSNVLSEDFGVGQFGTLTEDGYSHCKWDRPLLFDYKIGQKDIKTEFIDKASIYALLAVGDLNGLQLRQHDTKEVSQESIHYDIYANCSLEEKSYIEHCLIGVNTDKNLILYSENQIIDDEDAVLLITHNDNDSSLWFHLKLVAVTAIGIYGEVGLRPEHKMNEQIRTRCLIIDGKREKTTWTTEGDEPIQVKEGTMLVVGKSSKSGKSTMICSWKTSVDDLRRITLQDEAMFITINTGYFLRDGSSLQEKKHHSWSSDKAYRLLTVDSQPSTEAETETETVTETKEPSPCSKNETQCFGFAKKGSSNEDNRSCLKPGNCTVTFIIEKDKQDYNFYLRGNIDNKQYISAGFSKDRKMGDDVVFDCNVVNSPKAEQSLSWNLKDTNELVGVSRGVKFNSTNRSDRKTECVFKVAKFFYIKLQSGSKKFINLRDENYKILLAYGNLQNTKGRLLDGTFNKGKHTHAIASHVNYLRPPRLPNKQPADNLGATAWDRSSDGSGWTWQFTLLVIAILTLTFIVGVAALAVYVQSFNINISYSSDEDKDKDTTNTGKD